MLRMFRKKADQNSFELFDNILEGLTTAGKRSSITVTYNVKQPDQHTTVEAASFDDEVSFAELTDTTRTEVNSKQVCHFHTSRWETLPEKLQALKEYLEKNTTRYSNSDIVNISKKTLQMIKKIDAYLHKPDIKKLAEARQAKNDFQNAFETNNIFTAGLVGAVLGAIAGLLAGPLGIIPGAVTGFKAGTTGAAVGGGTGMVLALLRKTLCNRNTGIKTYINKVKKAVETLLPNEETLSELGTDEHFNGKAELISTHQEYERPRTSR